MRPLALWLLLALLSSSSAAAQEVTAEASEDACGTGPVSFIFIDNHSIFDVSDPELNPRFRWAYRLANSLHVKTRRSVIRRELLFQVGDCYDPILLEETERLLRAYDFLAHVDVFGIQQPDGSYHILVDTEDEWSTRVDLRLGFGSGTAFEGLEVQEANLLGTGQRLGIYYRERGVRQDYGISFLTPQLARTRWDAQLAVGRTRAGTAFAQAFSYPFVGEDGRWAARQSFRREDRHFAYLVGDGGASPTHVLLPLRDKAMDLALVTRIGVRGNLTLFGGTVSFQELSFPGGLAGIEVAHGNNYDDRDTAEVELQQALLQQMHPLSTIRVGVLVGQRNIWFVQRRGLDALRGEQDVRLGAEAEVGLARSVPSLEQGNDLFANFGFYSGVELGRWLTTGEVRADVRRDLRAPADASEWEDLFAEGQLLVYWRPAGLERHTFVLRAAGAGGWHTSTPFQLTLGGDHAVRGFSENRFPGGHRAVLSLEDRVYFGWPLPDVADIGGTAFVDVGRVWPGDAPFGGDSGWRTSAGLGVRTSFPAGGRTTYRLDFAFPIGGDGGAKDYRLILSVGEQLGITRRFGDPQVARSRPYGPSGELFHFPR